MSLRYLFGPVTSDNADRCFSSFRMAGSCITFGTAAGVDVVLPRGCDWPALLRRVPDRFIPDCLVLCLPCKQILSALHDCPLPIIALAPDWRLLWHCYRLILPRCDLVLTDRAGVDVMGREGIGSALAAKLYGFEKDLAAWDVPPAATRDIDILFVSNVHPAIAAERNPWIGRVRQFASRWKVVIGQTGNGEKYQRLLARSRIVFILGSSGEADRQTLEAARAGALVFLKQGNVEIEELLPPREACVTFDAENWLGLLEHYLEHDGERQKIASRGEELARQFTFENFWNQSLEAIEAQWPTLLQRANLRVQQAKPTEFSARVWEAASSNGEADSTLVRDLAKASIGAPHSAGLHNALGVVTSVREFGKIGSVNRNLGEPEALAPGVSNQSHYRSEPPGANASGSPLSLEGGGIACGFLAIPSNHNPEFTNTPTSSVSKVPAHASGSCNTKRPLTPEIAKRLAVHFRKAVACDANYVVAGLNLAEALAIGGDSNGACTAARRTLKACGTSEGRSEENGDWHLEDSEPVPVSSERF